MKTLFVTGGAGFIGSALVRHLVAQDTYRVVVIDKLTYAGNLLSLAQVADDERFIFVKVDICDSPHLASLFEQYRPDAVIHLAAESHVDRSIDGPDDFIQTNIVGTFRLLQQSLAYWQSLATDKAKTFRFHHVSTDEVYGSLGLNGLFTEQTAYDPNSPYSASKAASDHLVRAWGETYGLPFVLTNCSNNYGPYHFPEKLVPLVILNALAGKELPIYGSGLQVRDWLYVDDHARALCLVMEQGGVGETYNIGGFNEKTNLEVVSKICGLLEELMPSKPPGVERYVDLITHVADRPGHDARYAIDASKIERELGWRPQETFDSGLRKTVEWFLANQTWTDKVLDGSYQMERLGLGERGL